MASNQEMIPPFETGYSTPEKSRAEFVRRDTDTIKTPKVDIYDIDYAILYHLNSNARFKVEEAGAMIDVKAIYADSEKWSQIKSRGYLRDVNKQLMAPLIAIRRTSVGNDDRLRTLSLHNKKSTFLYYPYRTLQNQYDRFGDQINRKPSQEIYAIQMPTYVRVNYDLIIWTHLVTQMNILVQGILDMSDHMWGDYHTFRTRVEEASMNVTNAVGEDRVVSVSIPIVVDGYLASEFEYQESTMTKAFTVKTVRVENEREESGVSIEDGYYPDPSSHISQEDPYILQQNMRRNIRYR